jgi:hypothetical protein
MAELETKIAVKKVQELAKEESKRNTAQDKQIVKISDAKEIATKEKKKNVKQDKDINALKKEVGKLKATPKVIIKTGTLTNSTKVTNKNPVTKKSTTTKPTIVVKLADAKKTLQVEKKKNAERDKEISKLKKGFDKLKLKKRANHPVSEYNVFIRKQVASGIKFADAAKKWSELKLKNVAQKGKTNAYNEFIKAQRKMGKTFAQAVALWNQAKKGKIGKTERRIVKTVKKDIKQIRKKAKPYIKEIKKQAPIYIKEAKEMSEETITKLKEIVSKAIESGKPTISGGITRAMVDEDEIAFRIIDTYFKEIARFGVKKQLTLDEVINAYLYSRAKVKKLEVDAIAMSAAIKDAGLKN